MVLCLVGTPVSAATLPAGTATTSDAGSLTATSVSISEIQSNTTDGDTSAYLDQQVTTTGTVTAVDRDGFHIQSGTGQYSGVYVYVDGNSSVSVGDTVEVTGTVARYRGVTQIDVTGDSASVSVTGSAQVPDPVTLSTGDVGQEAYEGVLVRVENVEVTKTPGEFGEWAVDDGSGEIAIDNVAAGDSTTPEETGATADAIEGPVFHDFGAFKIRPTSVENLQAPSGGGDGGNVSGTTLTVLSYNDIQTAASNATKMGLLEGAINQRLSAIDNPTVVVGGGDQVSPSSFSPISNWTVPIDTLNVVDPAAEVVGNHDLDYGFDAVTNFTAASEFPWLVANIQKAGSDGENIPGTKDYTIVERDGVKIGIVGLVDEAIKGKTAVDFQQKGYEVTDFVDVGSRIATELKNEKNVDVVIAATHIGVPESKELARNTDNIDLIVTGDDEIKFAPQEIDGTVIMEAKARAAFLGEANVTVGEDDVSLQSGRLLTVDGRYQVNQTVYDIVNESRGKYLSQVVGSTQVSLDSTFGSNYAEDTRWGNVITDAFLAETGADVAITNAGGIRGNFVIEPGDITYNDVYTSLPFGNYLVTKEMTGAQLKQLLASQVTRLDARFGGQAQLQVSGVSYEFVDRPDAETKVMELFVNGEPIRMNRTYEVTVNSYMAGWDRISQMPTVDEDFTLYGEATAKYVQANSPITEAKTGGDRIRRVTREVGESAYDLSGDTATLTYEVPAEVGEIDPSTFHLNNENGDTLAATDASLSGNTLTVEFDAGELRTFQANSDTLELYGSYNDTAVDSQRNGFDQSVLNGEVIEQGNVVTVIWGDDRQLSDEELNTAVQYWVSQDPVPGTDGAVISNRLLNIIVQKWVVGGS